MAERQSQRILVGVDGSLSARAALRWAVEHARPEDIVVVVHAWKASPSMVDAGLCDPDDDAPARNLVEHEIAHVRALASELGIHLVGDVVAGGAQELCNVDADLVVVGASGHGAVSRRLLGSVSDFLVRHGHHPIVIVPPIGPSTAQRSARGQ